MSDSRPHPTTDIPRQPKENVVNHPMEIRQRYRFYTSNRQRKRLGIDTDDYGLGTEVRVKLQDVHRDTEWGYAYRQETMFKTTLRTYGVIGIPPSVVETMGLTVGSTLRVDICVV